MNFSVLMSVYYKENPNYLKQALESVINQTVKPTEIVMVKDGRLTAELDLVIECFNKEFPKLLKVVELKKNQGLGTALKEGVKACAYDLIARMDTDDIAINNRFEKQIYVLSKNPEIDMVGSFIKEFDGGTDNILSIRKVPENFLSIKEYARKRNPFNHMTVMFRKNAVLKAGNYEPFLWNEDYYLWIRMIMNGSKMCNIPESLVFVRIGDEMYKRRGGIKYVGQEIRLQKEFLNLGFTTKHQFISNIVIRTFIRIIPNNVRKFLYINYLRST